jgi:hypothetical protein
VSTSDASHALMVARFLSPTQGPVPAAPPGAPGARPALPGAHLAAGLAPLASPSPGSRLVGRQPHHKVGQNGLGGQDPPFSEIEGTNFSTDVADFTDSDGNTDPTKYTVGINWGDGNSSNGWVQTASGGGFSAFGGHSYADFGSFTVTVTINDADGDSTSVTDPATVIDGALSWTTGGSGWLQQAGQQPTVTAPAAQTSAEGAAVSLQVQASSPNHYALTYDALNLPVGLSINPSTGLISGTVDYAAAEDFGGSYSPTVTVSDGHGGSASTTFSWTVSDTRRPPVLTTPGNQTGAAGQTVSLQVSATDADGNPLIYFATGLPSGLSIDTDTGLISGSIDPSAASPTPYSVTLSVDDGSGNPVTGTFSWSVTAANLAPQLTSPGNQTNAAGDAVSQPLTASDTDGDTLTYTASGLPAGLSIDPGSGTISGTIANSAASATPYSVTVMASDGVASSSQAFTWTVNYVGLTNPGDQSNLYGDCATSDNVGRLKG